MLKVAKTKTVKTDTLTAMYTADASTKFRALTTGKNRRHADS